MKDWFYFLVYAIGVQPLWLTSSPVILHRDRAARKGPFILAANHFSPYDVACLIKETPRVLDFLSVVEVFKHPLAAWFFYKMKAFPLDRWKADSGTVRTMVERLKNGRVIAMFPEGAIRSEETSVLNGGRLKPGVARIAKLAGVPIIPAVIVGTRGFHQPRNWIPLRKIKYGIIYGPAIDLSSETDESLKSFEDRLRQVYLELHRELKQAMEGLTPST